MSFKVQCSCCGRELPLAAFYKNKACKSGYQTSKCKKCILTSKKRPLVVDMPLPPRCKKCGKIKDIRSFSKHKDCRGGYDFSRCKQCKKSERDWASVSQEKRIYNRAKERAKQKGLVFSLNLDDIVIPELCPVFGKPLKVGDTDWTPSIDRINPEKGYTKDNIVIISNKANRTKNNASLEELEMLLHWLRNVLKGGIVNLPPAKTWKSD